MTITLPVYELDPASADPGRLSTVARELFGIEKPSVQERSGRLVVAHEGVTAELFTASGTIFAADYRRLRVPSQHPSLPDAQQAYRRAAELMEQTGLSPELGHDEFELVRLEAGGTVVASRTGGRRSQHALDVQARFAVTVRNPGVPTEPDRIPLVGGGGKVTFTFGEDGRLIGYQGGWRRVAGRRVVEALDRVEAAELFRKSTEHLEIRDLHGHLAYYAAPGDADQQLLTPVWVFGGSIVSGRHQLPMRMVTIPATEFGPVVAPSKAQPRRHSSAKPAKAVRGAANPAEAGTSWIGSLGGLPGSQQNAQGFVDGLAADGWNVNFNWGDANAFVTDWDTHDDDWVDAADFVFYTGHASMDGWLLTTPGTTNLVTLTPSVVGSAPQTPGDKWGQQDLEWIIVAACGPLQDEAIAAGGGDVLTRWEGAFDGLHTLMGYGSITVDNTEEGRKIAQYCREGTPVIDAWFRAAQEVQPSTNGRAAPNGPDVWVGAMWVTKPGADPRQDHIWGHGWVSPDPTSPSTLVCMWTTC